MGWTEKLYNCTDSVLNLLLPQRCLVCGGHISGEIALCGGCRGDLPFNLSPCPRCGLSGPRGRAEPLPCGNCQRRPPAFDRVFAPLLYQPPVDRLVIGLKYHQQLSAAELLAEVLCSEALRQGFDVPQSFIPVPLHRSRTRQRGYNQAQLLARYLGNRLQVDVEPGSAIRLRDTASQSGLDLPGRRRNVRGAFQLRQGPQAAHLALVDDVMTTGSTVAELAKLYKGAGVGRVDVWCAARAVR